MFNNLPEPMQKLYHTKEIKGTKIKKLKEFDE